MLSGSPGEEAPKRDGENGVSAHASAPALGGETKSDASIPPTGTEAADAAAARKGAAGPNNAHRSSEDLRIGEFAGSVHISAHNLFQQSSITGDVKFGAGNTQQRQRTWLDELIEDPSPKRIDPAIGRDPLYRRALDLLQGQGRILQIRHHGGARAAAREVTATVVAGLAEAAPHRRVFTTGSDCRLTLADLALAVAQEDRWRGALIYLVRGRDIQASRFFGADNRAVVAQLTQRLTVLDSRLVVSFAAAPDDIDEGDVTESDDTVGTWVVGERVRETAAAPSATPLTTFEAVAQVVAGALPGLGVKEYCEAVNLIVSDEEQHRSSAAAAPVVARSAVDTKGKQRQPPTRHERWLQGETDQVLSELGIEFRRAMRESDVVGSGLLSGYGIADESSPFASPDWVVTRYPALLVRRIDALVDRYFLVTSSDAYRSALADCLSRLDFRNIFPVRPAWMVDRFLRALHSDAGIVDPEAFVGLVKLFLVGSRGSAFGEQVLNALADFVVEAEVRFFSAIPGQRSELALALVAATEPDDASGTFWSNVLHGTEVAPHLQLLVLQQSAALNAMVHLVESLPSEVCRALVRVMARLEDSQRSVWPLWRDKIPNVRSVQTSATIVLRLRLSEILSQQPAVWFRLMQGLAQAGEISKRPAATNPANAIQKPARSRLSPDARRLGVVCIGSLTQVLDEMLESVPPSPDLGSTLMQDRHRDGCQAIGVMLVRCMHQDPHDPADSLPNEELSARYVAYLLRRLCEAMRLVDGAATLALDRALAAVVGGLRQDQLPAQRRSLLEAARDQASVLQSRARELAAAGRSRQDTGALRTRLQAAQAVVRALSALPTATPA